MEKHCVAVTQNDNYFKCWGKRGNRVNRMIAVKNIYYAISECN